MDWRSAAFAFLVVMLAGAAQAAPNIPNSELPGRERERFFDSPMQPTPRIELKDGRPKRVIRSPDKRKKRPGSRPKR